MSSPATIHPYVSFFLNRYTTEISEQQIVNSSIATKSAALLNEALSILNGCCSSEYCFGFLKDKLDAKEVVRIALSKNESLSEFQFDFPVVDEASFVKARAQLMTDTEIMVSISPEWKALLAKKSSEVKARFLSAFRQNPTDLETIHAILGLKAPTSYKVNNSTAALIHQISRSDYERAVLKKYIATIDSSEVSFQEQKILLAESIHIIIMRKTAAKLVEIWESLPIVIIKDYKRALLVLAHLEKLNRHNLGFDGSLLDAQEGHAVCSSLSDEQMVAEMKQFAEVLQPLESMDDLQAANFLNTLKDRGKFPKEMTLELLRQLHWVSKRNSSNSSEERSSFLKALRTPPTKAFADEIKWEGEHRFDLIAEQYPGLYSTFRSLFPTDVLFSLDKLEKELKRQGIDVNEIKKQRKR